MINIKAIENSIIEAARQGGPDLIRADFNQDIQYKYYIKNGKGVLCTPWVFSVAQPGRARELARHIASKVDCLSESEGYINISPREEEIYDEISERSKSFTPGKREYVLDTCREDFLQQYILYLGENLQWEKEEPRFIEEVDLALVYGFLTGNWFFPAEALTYYYGRHSHVNLTNRIRALAGLIQGDFIDKQGFSW